MESRNKPAGFANLRVLSLESRRATEMAKLIETYGGIPIVAPSMREIPLESNTDAQAFTQMFTASTPAGEALRRAVAICRGAAPVAPSESVDIDKADQHGDAYAQLTAMAERAVRPGESFQQAFARVFAANPALAKRERAQSLRKLYGV